MILGVIFLFTVCLPLLLILYFVDRAATKPDGNLILGCTVPTQKMEDSDLLKIIEKYKKRQKKFMHVNIITAIPMLVIGIKSIFILSLYLIMWIFFILGSENICLKKSFNEIQRLKREKDWFIMNKRVIRVDTVFSREKNKMAISFLYFIPVFLINIIGIIFLDNPAISLSTAFTVFLCFILYVYYLKRFTKVYSKDTDINFACNLVNRREWSIMLIVISFIVSIPNIAFIFSEEAGIITISLSIFAIILVLFRGYYKIKDTQNKLLCSVNNEIYEDDDEYWNGLFYNNPNDKRFMVDKRIGIGTTINFAHPAAKVFVGVTVFILLAALIPAGVMIYKLSNADFIMNVENTKVSIEAPMYNTDFNKEDIESINIIDEMPKASRTNGAEDEKISLGNYKVKGYGDSKVYVKKKVNKIVVIKLKNNYIFITGNNEYESQKYYDELKNTL